MESGVKLCKKIMGDSYPTDVDAYLISISNISFIEAMQPEVEKQGMKLLS